MFNPKKQPSLLSCFDKKVKNAKESTTLLGKRWSAVIQSAGTACDDFEDEFKSSSQKAAENKTVLQKIVQADRSGVENIIKLKVKLAMDDTTSSQNSQVIDLNGINNVFSIKKLLQEAEAKVIQAPIVPTEQQLLSEIEAESKNVLKVEDISKAKLVDASEAVEGTTPSNLTVSRIDAAGCEKADLEFWELPQAWDSEVTKLNTVRFKNEKFRYMQRAIINAALSGRDMFVCMPTGAGKSLSFQLPACYTFEFNKKMTVVIEPTVALVHDQERRLGPVMRIMSHLTEWPPGLERSEKEKQKARTPLEAQLKLSAFLKKAQLGMVFVTPEVLVSSEHILNALIDCHKHDLIARFVIDEAHCVIKWGADFRPDYIASMTHLRGLFPGVPLIALSATAPEQIRKNTVELLKLSSPLYFESPFNRPNLRYMVVRKTKPPEEQLASFIKRYNGSTGIVYSASITLCDHLQAYFGEYHPEIKSAVYHSKIPREKKIQTATNWQTGAISVVFATIAFGLGVDKSDVRFVIHFTPSKSPEDYFQESGRAGRDGKLADCILLYSETDFHLYQYMFRTQQKSAESHVNALFHLNQVQRYCEDSVNCRREFQMAYLGQDFSRKDCFGLCDNCHDNWEYEERDCTTALRELHRHFGHERGLSWFGMSSEEWTELLKGKSAEKSLCLSAKKIHGLMKAFPEREVKRFVKSLLYNSVLVQRQDSEDENSWSYYLAVNPRVLAALGLLLHNTDQSARYFVKHPRLPTNNRRFQDLLLSEYNQQDFTLLEPSVIATPSEQITVLPPCTNEVSFNQIDVDRPTAESDSTDGAKKVFGEFGFCETSSRRHKVVSRLREFSRCNSSGLLPSDVLDDLACYLPESLDEFRAIPYLLEDAGFIDNSEAYFAEIRAIVSELRIDKRRFQAAETEAVVAVPCSLADLALQARVRPEAIYIRDHQSNSRANQKYD